MSFESTGSTNLLIIFSSVSSIRNGEFWGERFSSGDNCHSPSSLTPGGAGEPTAWAVQPAGLAAEHGAGACGASATGRDRQDRREFPRSRRRAAGAAVGRKQPVGTAQR